MTLLRRSAGSVGSSVMLVALALAATACDGDTNNGRDSGTTPGVDAQVVPTDAQVVDTGLPIVADGGDGGSSGRVCNVPGGGCDVIAQDCPSATDGCYLAIFAEGAEATTMCVAAGTAVDGEACAQVNDCARGLTCNNDVCRRHCCMGSSSDCEGGTGQFCVGLSGAEPLGQCEMPSGCTLAPNAGCPGTQACYPARADGTLGCFAPSPTAAGEGETCDSLNDCVAGTGCFGMGSPAVFTCSKFCRIDMGATDCSAGRTCAASTGGLVLPANIGLCPPAA